MLLGRHLCECLFIAMFVGDFFSMYELGLGGLVVLEEGGIYSRSTGLTTRLHHMFRFSHMYFQKERYL